MSHAFILNILKCIQSQTVVNIRNKESQQINHQILFNFLPCVLKLNVDHVLNCTLLEEVGHFFALIYYCCYKKMRALNILLFSKKIKVLIIFYYAFNYQINSNFFQHKIKIDKSVLHLSCFIIHSVFIDYFNHFSVRKILPLKIRWAMNNLIYWSEYFKLNA